MRNRLWRRHQKLKRARSLVRWGFPAEIALRFADNRKPCSSLHCCCNPRKHGILPVQERRELAAERIEQV